MRTPDTSRLFLSVLFLLLAFTGCGRKNPPVPLKNFLPAAIEDLRYSITAEGAILTWTPPDRTTEGEPLAAIERFEIFRAIVTADACDGCPLSFQMVAITPGIPALPAGRQSTTSFRQTDLQQGRLYYYKVRTKTGWQTSSRDSNIISFRWEAPLPPSP